MTQQTEHICALATEKAVQGNLSFSFGCSCLSPYITPHSCLPCSKSSLGEQCVCIQVRLHVCACVHMFPKLKLERQLSQEVRRVQYSWRRLCIFTGIRQTEAPFSSHLIPPWFSARTLKARLTHKWGDRALAPAAAGMFPCQLLPHVSRLSQALSGFQMATGFQDCHR